MNQAKQLTSIERRAVWATRWKLPRFFLFTYGINLIAFIFIFITAYTSMPSDITKYTGNEDITAFAFTLGVFITALIFNIFITVWHKETWIDAQIKAEDKYVEPKGKE